MFYAIANVPRFWQELCLSLGLGRCPAEQGSPGSPALGGDGGDHWLVNHQSMDLRGEETGRSGCHAE